MRVNDQLKPGEKRISVSGRWITQNEIEIEARALKMAGHSESHGPV
jgi:hypothetical protein